MFTGTYTIEMIMRGLGTVDAKYQAADLLIKDQWRI
jgi:hypothetical protein